MPEEPLIDVSPENWRIVHDILQRYVPDREVWAFGSRAKWTAKEYSDLDIAIIGEDPLNMSVMAELKDAFQESELPFKVDVVDWATTKPPFRRAIESSRFVVQRKSGNAVVADDPWREMTLGDFVTLQRGHDLPDRDRREGTVPILGSFGVTGHHNEARAPGPGITVGRSGASFGVVSYSQKPFWPLNTALYVRDFHGNDVRFAYYLLHCIDFKGFNSGSAQPSLNRNFIHPISVRVGLDPISWTPR